MKCEECYSEEFEIYNDSYLCKNCHIMLPLYVDIEFTKQILYTKLSVDSVCNLQRLITYEDDYINDLIKKLIDGVTTISQKKKRFIVLYIMFSYCIYSNHINELLDFIPEWDESQYKKSKNIMRQFNILGYFCTLNFIPKPFIVEFWYYNALYAKKIGLSKINNIQINNTLFDKHFPKTISLASLVKFCNVKVEDISKNISIITLNKIMKIYK